ncbi:MAG: DUF4935 domain-containing protein [Candidatus Methylomirabilis oxygeniifera]|uniref:DUF4935 domain-containing protein n=1 Tax=Methylomirabilis oxygeniifera TaxID=671143 RepID=D5MHR4_METO1|nr:MAG: DUF4935 domain-containing protein [Candidatus Methylomirabilis oxyfera]CBE67197.1 protein of unknown function [Candidatus Methylomirabilis oxyfera]
MFETWLDTNVVRRWNLRLNTAEARKFFKYVQDFKLKIFLPEVVLRELVQNYADEASECRRKQNELKKSLAKLGFSVDEGKGDAVPGNLDDYFHNLLTHQCAEKSITVVPLSKVPVERLLDMAIKRIAPFQQKGERGFRDALILFCLLEHTRQPKQGPVFLVSEDKVFKEESIGVLAAEYGVDLAVYESVDTFTTFLDTLRDQLIQGMKRKQAERVRAFLREHTDEIKRFIQENAEFEEAFLSGGLFSGAPYLGTIRRVGNIVLKDIAKVTTIQEDSGEQGIVTVLITFEVRLEIELETEKLWVPEEPKRYRVGQEVEQIIPIFRPQLQMTRVNRAVVCEAVAKERTEDNRLSDLQLKEVKLRANPFEALRVP